MYTLAKDGQFVGHIHEQTNIGYGMHGSPNDLNVLHWSHLFSELIEGRAPPANHTINGHQYTMGYYLVDGIYPQWASLVQTIFEPQVLTRQLFAKMQEAYRKDGERAFGVLQASFSIVRGLVRFWSNEDLGYIIKICIILHNMIIKDEHDDSLEEEYDAS